MSVQPHRGPPEARASDPAPVVRCIGVGKDYLDGSLAHRVLDSVDLEIEAGERVALIGRSGSGKSTLLNLLAGIDTPHSGRVEILGQDLGALGEPGITRLRRRHIGFVYQMFNLLPTLTVAENLLLPLHLNGERTPADDPRVQALLDRLGLAGRARTADRVLALEGGRLKAAVAESAW